MLNYKFITVKPQSPAVWTCEKFGTANKEKKSTEEQQLLQQERRQMAVLLYRGMDIIIKTNVAVFFMLKVSNFKGKKISPQDIFSNNIFFLKSRVFRERARDLELNTSTERMW